MYTLNDYLYFLKQKKLTKVSKNFTLYDLFYSHDAIYKYKISNIPLNNSETLRVEGAFKNLIVNVVQPTVDHFGIDPTTCSVYRNPTLNDKIGGVDTSQHCFGMAIDFVIGNISLQEIVKFIAKNLQFDQLILENSNGKKWIHVSYRAGSNRKQVLKYEHGVYLKYIV